MKTFLTIFRSLVQDKGSGKFAIGVLIGLAFSISAILGTIGIMDGFEAAMERNLRRAKGDLYFYSQSGFFEFDETFDETLKDIEIERYSPFVQTEGFAISGDVSKGVLIKGVERDSFFKVTGLDLKIKPGSIAIGKELAGKLSLKVGDGVTLAFANGNEQFKGLPLLERFNVAQLVDHGIYQHDLRMAYLPRSQLQQLLDVGNKVNVVTLDISGEEYEKNPTAFKDRVQLSAKEVRLSFPPEFRVRPFWQEFGTLLEAVKIEKLIIGLILQLIVVVSVFNVIAFVIFLNERKARDIFLFKALGMRDRKSVV